MNTEKLSTKTLVILEDELQAREYLYDILKLYFKEVISFCDGCEALDKIHDIMPDIVVSDIKMPCLDGISFMKKIVTKEYQPILILTTAFSDKEYMLDAIDLKVAGYLIKPINIDMLLDKIDNALISFDNINLKYKQLSKREYEVFIDISKGLKPSEISIKYDVKAKTISTYRRRIFKKMGFSTNAELISYRIKNKLS